MFQIESILYSCMLQMCGWAQQTHQRQLERMLTRPAERLQHSFSGDPVYTEEEPYITTCSSAATRRKNTLKQCLQQHLFLFVKRKIYCFIMNIICCPFTRCTCTHFFTLS